MSDVREPLFGEAARAVGRALRERVARDVLERSDASADELRVAPRTVLEGQR